MGQAYIPGQSVTDIYVGNTTVANPYITIVVGGVAYPNGYRIDYAGGFRNFCGAYDSSNGNVYVRCHAIAYGEDLPEYTLSNVDILVIGEQKSPPTGTPTITSVYFSRNGDNDDVLNITWTHVANAKYYNIYISSNYPSYSYYTLFQTIQVSDTLAAGSSVYGGGVWYNFTDSSIPDHLKIKVVAVGYDQAEYNAGYYTYS
jgi:hypothetical protein